jgi:hypothetical protein
VQCRECCDLAFTEASTKPEVQLILAFDWTKTSNIVLKRYGCTLDLKEQCYFCHIVENGCELWKLSSTQHN